MGLKRTYMYQWVILFFLLLCCGDVLSQGETNNWYFGQNAGITFNNGSPQVLTDGMISTDEGCATISDSDGQLLFYTDGITIRNRIHNIMPNGTGLLGHVSSTQSGIIVPTPNNPNLYYVFTVDAYAGKNGLRYSIVDMTLNGGLGDVTDVKNVLLMTPTSEKISAALHANGQDIWVLTHGMGTNEFYAFLVTATGIISSPITSSTGAFVPNTGGHSIGVLKFSPKGDRLAMCVSDISTQIFSFNSATGIVSNPRNVYIGPVSYGAEFSPSGNVLYVTHNYDRMGLWQYDLTASNISDSAQFIYEVPGSDYNQELGSLQLGSDNKLYVSIRNRYYLSVINNPESLGLACDFVADALFLEGGRCKYGLPAFIQSYFYVGFEYENVCVGSGTQFTSNISDNYDSLLWDFGDGTTSTVENPIHTFVSSGNFTVTLTAIAGGQSSKDAKNIIIYEKPIVKSVMTLSQCDDDLDGFTAFNLTELHADLSANHEDETINFFLTQAEAEAAENVITNEAAYTNQIAFYDVIWGRIENFNGCYEISQINLIVSTTHIPNNYSRNFYKCDVNNDGIATFNFSSVSSEIRAMFPSDQQPVVNYYRNQADALMESNPITNISNYQNNGYPNTQNIFVRVDNSLNNECLGLGHHITLYAEPVPVAKTVTISPQCDTDGDGMFAFDTSMIEMDLLNGQTNINITFRDEVGSHLTSLPNPFLTPTQTITAILTNTFSQDPDGPCYIETEIHFQVEPAAVANPVNDFIGCDEDSDGLYSFDTSTIELMLLNGQTNMVITYTDSNNDNLPSPLPNPFVTNTQKITAKVQSLSSIFCYDQTTISFVVSEVPIAYPVINHFICDDPLNDGQEIFILSNYDDEILAGQSVTEFEVKYFDTFENANNNNNSLTNNYVVDSYSQIVYGRIQNINNPNCYDITEFELGVNNTPIANPVRDIQVCDDESNDGVETFYLSSQSAAVLNGQSSTENNVSYHLTRRDAELNLSPMGLSFTNSLNPQTIYVRVENNFNPYCYDINEFDLHVRKTPLLTLSDIQAICEGYSIELIADAGYDEYLWSTGENTRTITVDKEGDYEVTAVNNYPDLSCETKKTIHVAFSDIATISNIVTADWTQNNNTISVYVEGNGEYEFSLDGVNYQESNIFKNLQIDDYTVYVRDRMGCGIVVEDIYLFYYPHFFTPNGDGYNETWQLYNSSKEPHNRIYIFDRYGKLLKQLNPSDGGWDGTFNGNPLPSNDYWFLLERQNGKTYRGHFTLKR